MPAHDERSIADILLAARARLHLTQDDMALRAGVSIRSVRRIENGQRVSTDTLRAVAAAIDVDVGTFPARPLPETPDTGTVSFVDAAIRKEIAAAGECILAEEKPACAGSQTASDSLYQRYLAADRSWRSGEKRTFLAMFFGLGSLSIFVPLALNLFSGRVETHVGFCLAAAIVFLLFGMSLVAYAVPRMKLAAGTIPSTGYMKLRLAVSPLRYILTDKAFWFVEAHSTGYAYRRFLPGAVVVTAVRDGIFGIRETTIAGADGVTATLLDVPEDGAVARFIAGGYRPEAVVGQRSA
jgi:transcriptional regulator with XRE-family HTH domain